MRDSFSSKVVSKILNIPMRVIDYWDRTDFIKPSVNEASGYGSVRLYSFADLVQFRVAKSLREKGLFLQKIRKSLHYLRKHLPDIEKPLAQLKFLTDGERIFVLTNNRKEIIDTLNEEQLVFSIAIGEFVKELRGKTTELAAERKQVVQVAGYKYEVTLHPDLEDGGYWVECPSLPGCSSQGDSIEEALDMIKDAIKGHLEVAEEERQATSSSKKVA
jgi:predicted RNase H-like HicB family nuclease